MFIFTVIIMYSQRQKFLIDLFYSPFYLRYDELLPYSAQLLTSECISTSISECQHSSDTQQ